MKKIIGIFVCTLLIATVLPVAGNIIQKGSMDEDWWPMYNHDLQNSGFTTSEAPDTGTLKWFFRVSSQTSSPVVNNGRVYFGDGYGDLYCLDMDTSEKIWEFAAGGEIPTTTSPAVVNGRVYVCSEDGKVHCLNEETGEEIWYYKTTQWIESSPAIANGRVYFGCYDDKLYCLDEETGGRIWDYETKGPVISSPAIANDKVYFGSFDTKVYCLNAVTGTKIWEYETNSYIQTTSPCISNGLLYIGSDDFKLYCLDAETGYKIWEYNTGGSIRSSPVVAYGNVYFGSVDGNAYCLDALNGNKIWNYDLGNWIHSSPSVADNKVYIACMGGDGQICCLNAQTGELIWNYHPMGVWSSPAIADGKLFFGCYNFYCFEDGPYYPPNVPDIIGPKHGEPNTEYDFTFVTTEPNGEDIYFTVNWGDGTYEDWFGPFESGEEVTLSHTFPGKSTYTVWAKAKDPYGLESDWARFEFSTPRSRVRNIPMFRIFELFPNLFRILQILI